MAGSRAAAELLVEVAVGLPVQGTFQYLLPAHLRTLGRIGVRVQVPFGKRKVVTGFIVGLPESSVRTDLREVEEAPDPEPVFNERQLEFYRFIAHYYLAPLGEVIRTALPAGLFKGTRPVLGLTEAGRRALAGPLLDEADRRLLDQLSGEELTIKALETRLAREAKGDVQRLMRWDFVEQRYRLAPLTAKRKVERCWRLRPGLSVTEAFGMLGRTTPKRIAVLQTLADAGGWIGIQQLSQQVAEPRATLNLLVAAGLAEEKDREVYRDVACDVGVFAAEDVELHEQQKSAIEAVEHDLQARRYQPFCLHGVTGSGKTEIYLRLVQRCLDLGRSAIVLVPEISLTPQFLGRFVSRLGQVVAPYHSQLSDGERYDQWRKMQRGEARVVVGARSALFAPFDEVGLIVVDEEHEPSFKQEDGVTYHARDLALKLGTLHRCPVVLGSATPSLETYAAAQAGRFRLLELTERPTGAPMPAVEMIDMREVLAHRPRRKSKSEPAEQAPRKETTVRRVLSERLLQALTETVAAGEQAILFLNRRGYSTYAVCLECGVPLKCPLCDIALTFHERSNLVRCHYCDYHSPPPATCANCAGVHLFFGGMGTERLEKEVGEALPNARLLRMDRDTIRKRRDLYDTLSAFARREADILVGTQMVAKGHDFPAVTLVGVIDADAALLFPDFRAAERAFQLVSQVAGRAGRADLPGRVLLQSFQPEHYALVAAAHHDYRAFFAEEARRRAELHYPPAGRLAVLKITAPNAKVGLEACRLAARAATWATSPGDIAGAATLGPAASLLHRVQGKHHWNLLIKAEKPADLHRLCSRLLARLNETRSAATFKLDIDAVSVM